MTHDESIALIKSMGAKFTPELKAPEVPMPFDGDYTQEKYATQMLDAYKKAGIPPEHVFAQSFSLADVLFWIKTEPAFGAQAVYLEDRYEKQGLDPNKPETWKPSMAELKAQGVKILAPPIWTMLALNDNKEIVPSEYAKAAKAAGLDLIGWSLERDGPLQQGRRLLSPLGQGSDRSRRRHADGAGCAGKTGRHPRHVFGLAGDDDVLCKLHGDEVRLVVRRREASHVVSVGLAAQEGRDIDNLLLDRVVRAGAARP